MLDRAREAALTVQEPVESTFGWDRVGILLQCLLVALDERNEGAVCDEVADEDRNEGQTLSDDSKVPLREDRPVRLEEGEDPVNNQRGCRVSGCASGVPPSEVLPRLQGIGKATE